MSWDAFCSTKCLFRYRWKERQKEEKQIVQDR